MTSFSGAYLEKIFTERVEAKLPNNLCEDQFSCIKLGLYSEAQGYYQETSLKMISKCRQGYKEIEVKGMCESDVSGLQFNIPVMDGKFLYKNAYCALCHLQTHYTPLNIIVYSGNGPTLNQVLTPLNMRQANFRSNFLSSTLNFYITDQSLIGSAKSRRYFECTNRFVDTSYEQDNVV